MGVVWRAHDEYLHRDVAIKELKLAESIDPRDSEAAVRRTLREARAAAKLRHPGIVTVHDVVIEDGLPWIVMELIEGRSLADILDNDGPLPLDQAAQVAIQVLQALDAAHHRGVLHRDVKPANIMLDGDRVVLTDFGIAVIDGASKLTGTGLMPGSPEYIAPERIDGQEATRAADMWSVGITLYAAIVGRTPFKRNDASSTLAAALSRQPDPDPRIGRLWPVVKGLLEKKPAERMEAKVAVERLNTVAGKLAPRAEGVPPPPPPVSTGPETRIDAQSEQVTDVDATAPNTRTAPPPLMPAYAPPRAAHDDVTFDPIFVPQPRRKAPRGILIGLVALLVVAIVVVVVAFVVQRPPDGKQSQSAPPTTTTPNAPPPTFLVEQREVLGFTIGVPVGWEGSNTPGTDNGERSDVLYVDKQSDPLAAAAEVQVRRDTTGTTAPVYLVNKDKSTSANQENTGYRQISLTKDQLEFEHGSAAGPVRYHVLTRARADKLGRLFIWTYALHANDQATLDREWAARRPVALAIMDSFKFNT
jgi:serine/threonine protein kinase